MAIQDEGSGFVSQAINALKRVGSTDPVQMAYRGSFALAGYAGLIKPSWVVQKSAKRGKGPSLISVKIPLTQCALRNFCMYITLNIKYVLLQSIGLF